MAKYSKLSIITPSFNQGQFLEETIRSVLNQDYPNFEYIIIDGGSSDNSIEIIKKYSHRIAYWVSEPDKGQAHAVNKGISHATGDIIGWLNSDDLYLPGCFKTIGSFFQQHPDIDLVYGDYYLINENSNILLKVKEIKVDFNIMLFGRNHVAQPTVFFRRRVLECAGLLDENLHHALDWEWWFRMSRHGVKFMQIPQFLAAGRWHANIKSMSPFMLQERRMLQRCYLRGKGLRNEQAISTFIWILDKYYRTKRHLIKLITRRRFDIVRMRLYMRKI